METKYPNLKKYTTAVKYAERDIIGREKEMDILRATFSRPELCNAILLGEAGSGKALDNNTLIPVNDERLYVRIGNLKVGDVVFNEQGKPVRVLGVYPQGLLDAYQVTQKDRASLVCNDEHIFSSIPYSDYSRYGELKDYTVRQMFDIGGKWYLPVCENPVDLTIDFQSYYDDYYLMGVLFATQLSDNKFLIKNEYILEMYDDLFVRPDDGANVVCRKTYDFHDMIEKIMLSDFKNKQLFVTGIVDSIGSLNSRGNQVILKYLNNEITDGLTEVFTSMGFRLIPRVSQSKYICYMVRGLFDKIRDFYKYNPHISDYLNYENNNQRSFLNHHHRNNLIEISIKKLDYQCEMTCIYVDGESHLFLATDNYIVTHNTALIQGLMKSDSDRIYREVSLSKMIADVGDNPDKIADMLKTLFDEVSDYRKEENHEIVLFIDEFHQVVQLSAAAVEVLKPLLADSGTRGIKVAAATTYEEFRQFISPNQPLVERLQRINLTQPNEEITVGILRGMAKRYGVENHLKSDALYHQIYEYTNRYIPASSQPRKSILLFDTMIGWHKAFNKKIDFKLLSDVIYQTQGVNVSFAVDGTTIKKRLDEKVYSQGYATSVIEKRLQVCVADLNNKSRPQATLLFTGSTGTGKSEICKQLAEILFEDKRNLHRFDMSEYSQPDSLERFRDTLTTKVWERPYSIIMLDEIEKACGDVTRLLLQVLDDARLSDRNGRETSFHNAYIILTTNAGSEVYRQIAQYKDDLKLNEEGTLDIMGDYEKLIRRSITDTQGENKFPPELLGRIDAIVPFSPLDDKTREKIVLAKLKNLKDEINRKYGISLLIHRDVIRYIVYDKLDNDSDSGGARAVISKIESEITVKIAKIINDMKYTGLGEIRVDVDGEMACDNKNMLDSQARIKVTMFDRVVI